MQRRFLLMLMPAAVLLAQPPGPLVELKGRIEKIRMAPGSGMPQIEVKSATATTTVLLGSMRFLMENNFSPKAGDTVTVSGFRSGDMVVAVKVEIAGRGKALELRDKDGRPLWRRGPAGTTKQ